MGIVEVIESESWMDCVQISAWLYVVLTAMVRVCGKV